MARKSLPLSKVYGLLEPGPVVLLTTASTDKFEKFGLTPKPGKQVSAPLIDECYANLECEVVDTSMVDKYGMFIQVIETSSKMR